MSDSLRDQLLGLGFKPAPKAEKPARPAHEPPRRDSAAGANPRAHQAAKPGSKPAEGHPRRDRGPRPGAGARPQGTHPQGGRPQPKPGEKPQSRKPPPRTQEEMDLAKAYAIRAQREKEERIEAERLKQEEARLRREAKAKLAEFLKDKGLNDPAADIARHFEYGTRIKRVYVNAEQLKALNAGELGVVQLDGRYLLVTADVLSQAETLFAASVALKVDPNAPAGDDPYADPQYQVPDDLVW
jgi:uncharacterized protein YaiL (DUF2058 family)